MMLEIVKQEKLSYGVNLISGEVERLFVLDHQPNYKFKRCGLAMKEYTDVELTLEILLHVTSK